MMMTINTLFIVALVLLVHRVDAFRVLAPNGSTIIGDYFRPFGKGFVGNYGDPSTMQRERINEGAVETATQELLYEGVSPRQTCPGMVGPFSDGNFYCTAREFGYCDRRSGACFCNVGYQGIDCSDCKPTHFKHAGSCFPKKLCPNDCSGSGDCDFWSGTCSCQPHRIGVDCSTKLCTIFSPLCQACTAEECLFCKAGYYLSGNSSNVCSSCYDFDPRCAGCTLEQGCTECADPILTSVRRSGYRFADPRLPLEEDEREFSVTLPFGTKSPESFIEAESFVISATPDNPLKDNSVSCAQGQDLTADWVCTPSAATHVVCGHNGIFTFTYPNYEVLETDLFFRVSVRRTGGGVGNISISYFINHLTTNESDIAATAPFTTIQQLVFEPGVVERTFLVGILDDNEVEENEVYQIVLETPEGGGSVGPQFRTNVTIIDDDLGNISPAFTYPLENSTTSVAGERFNVTIQGVYSSGILMNTGGELFFAVVEDYTDRWNNPVNGRSRNVNKFDLSRDGGVEKRLEMMQQSRHSRRTVCDVEDIGDGTYTVRGIVYEQGRHDLRIWHAFPGGLRGDYFYDSFFEKLALSRIDKQIHFEWGTGRIIPRGSDYISIRWTGFLMPQATGTHWFYLRADDHARMWIDGDLVLDHIHQTEADAEAPRPYDLQDGVLVELVVEYTEIIESAYAHLYWGLTDDKEDMEVIPQANFYSQYQIDQMPVEIKVVSGDTSPNTTECTGTGLAYGEVNKFSSFEFCPRDLFSNFRDDVGDYYFLASELFSAKVSLTDDLGHGGEGSEVLTPELVYNNNTHCFAGYYKPMRAGVYTLDIMYQEEWHNVVPLQHVAGSPFTVTVVPTKTFAPFSDIIDLVSPLELDAGSCHNFTIVSRDLRRNFRFQGGDKYDVYMYRVDYSRLSAGLLPGEDAPLPTDAPSSMPTSGPTALLDTDPFRLSYPVEDLEEVVRYGVVTDLSTGEYSVEICPVIAGVYEVHVLLDGKGVSNQPSRILDPQHSFFDTAFGGDTSVGQYVADSPYSLVVSHTESSAYTSTAVGDGLAHATVGVDASFQVTVRDAYDNVLIPTATQIAQQQDMFNLNASLIRTPEAHVRVWNFYNGSFTITYSAVAAGSNLLAVLLNGFHIKGSPFTVDVLDGRTGATYSFLEGAGLHNGQAGVLSYFQLFSFDFANNRKTDNSDVYTFSVTGANTIDGVMKPCPKTTASAGAEDTVNPTDLPDIIGAQIACTPDDPHLGHYWASFMPTATGVITISVFLDGELVDSKTYDALIIPFNPVAELTTIQGDLYNKVAGTEATVTLQLWDEFKNRVYPGGHHLELALLGVAGDWGTIEPFVTIPGPPDEYYYGGFYHGYPRKYGRIVDNKDGTYVLKYTEYKTGQYVLRLALAETGLNVTYFNNTDLGLLVSADVVDPAFAESRRQDGVQSSFGSTVSWTGDLSMDTYYGAFLTEVDTGVNLDLRESLGNKRIGFAYETHTPFIIDPHRADATAAQLANISSTMTQTSSKFREESWSARWFGTITPLYPEVYNFTIKMDDSSRARLFLGGVGNMMNATTPPLGATLSPNPGQELVMDLFGTSTKVGTFNFSDVKSREIVVEYIHHHRTNAFIQLFWQSPSTPYGLVPASAFHHWRNMSHYNTTIHPAELCSRCSTAVGSALTSAMVAHEISFVVYARDAFGNLLQRGGDVPTMVAIGSNGVAFRGDVEDYGNSTYRITYYPTQAGQFRMYVTMGCCAPHPNVGLPTEIHLFSHLLVEGAPFVLTVDPAPVVPEKSYAIGQGTVGGYAGEMHSFTVQYRDIHSNPTGISVRDHLRMIPWVVKLKFVDRESGNEVLPANDVDVDIIAHDNYTVVSYNMTKAGKFEMYVHLIDSSEVTTDVETRTTENAATIVTTSLPSARAVLGSPYRVTIAPNKAVAENIIIRGDNINSHIVRNITAGDVSSFELQLRDAYLNDLLHGGHKFYMRVLGSASFSSGSLTNGAATGDMADIASGTNTGNLPVIPACKDLNNGRVVCTYTPIHSGKHRLHVALVNYSLSHPGGQGLTGVYRMDSAITGYSEGNDDEISSITRIDPSVSFSLPTGYVLPADLSSTTPTASGSSAHSTTTNSPSNIIEALVVTPHHEIKMLYNKLSFSNFLSSVSSNSFGNNFNVPSGQQSISWNGFLAVPKTNEYKFSTTVGSNHITVGTVYIDDVIVFDSAADVQLTVSLLENVVYKIEMYVSINSESLPNNKPVAIALSWSAKQMSWMVIPQFYLFDSAEPIAYSPFPLMVKD